MKKVTKWSHIRGKTNIEKWKKVKTLAEKQGVPAMDLLSRLLEADVSHGFVKSTGENDRPEHFATFDTLDERIMLNAAYFTVTRYRGRLQGHDRSEFATLPEALRGAGDDPRNLVYAVTHAGRHVNISKKESEWFLALYTTLK